MNLGSTRAEEKKTKHRGKLPQLSTSPTSTIKTPSTSPLLQIQPQPPANSHPSWDQTAASLTKTNSANTSKNQTECGTTHSIDTWVQISNQHSPAASSSGVYFISDIRDVPQVFYLPSPKSWPTQISYLEGGVHHFQISPDGKRIALTTQVGGDEQYDLYLWENYSLSPLVVDRNKRIESFQWSPDSKWIFFTSNARNKVDMDLYRWNIEKNSMELLLELEGSNTISDISPDSKWIAITRLRSVTDSELLLFNFESKQLNTLSELKTPIALQQGLFTGDSKGIFYLSDHETGHSQVYFTKLNLLNHHKSVTSGAGEAEEIVFDHSRRRLIIHKNEDGYSALEGILVDESGNRKNLFPVPKLKTSIIRGLNFSPEPKNPTFFFSQSNSLYPAEIFSWKNESITQWTNSAENILKAQCLSREQLVFYPTSDGRKIPAFLYLPSSKNFTTPKLSEPIPFIVYIHGGPESQFRPTFNKIFHYFLERGYGVFAPNVRGSTGYGREYTLLDNYKLRMDSVRDAIEGSQWLIHERLARKGSLGVYGGSYGGFMVLSMIENAPELFSAASESVGISNFISFLKNTKPYRRKLREVEYGPLSDEAFLASISPINHVDKIKTPLLIFHGANDPRVPVTEAEQIVAALKKRDIPVESKIFSDEGHGNLKLRNILEQARWMVNFFDKNFQSLKKEGVSSSQEETP